VDEEAIRDVIVLLRAHAKNKNHHDAVFADKLEAALSAQPAERQGVTDEIVEHVQYSLDNHEDNRSYAEQVSARSVREALEAVWQKASIHPAAPVGVPDGMAEMSEVWIVQDEAGLPIYCASYPEACHEHINDAINEHGIEEAKAWKVLRFGNYVFVPCRTCNGTRVAVAAPSSPQGVE
jgi:hypothetical protein